MEKIYGYKQSDVIGLAEFLKTRRGESLSEMFSRYAIKCGKAKGTVRNLYYALAKMSKEDEDFCNKYLSGNPISVSEIVEFKGEEEEDLIKKILSAKSQGKSVRCAINELAEGDGKRALRYQNKYRNAVKNKPDLVRKLIGELESEGEVEHGVLDRPTPEQLISDDQLLRLKTEINNLVERISSKTKKENKFLKERIVFLERENLRLANLLYKDGVKGDALRFFRARRDKDMLN